MLEGRNFTLFTDHKPLTHTLFRSSPPCSARQQPHLAYISKFTSDIVHVPGTEKTVADTLSRPFNPPSASAPCFRPQSVPTPSTSSSPPLVLIFLACQLSKLLALPSKQCCAAPPSLLSQFPFSDPLFFVTCPPDHVSSDARDSPEEFVPVSTQNFSP